MFLINKFKVYQKFLIAILISIIIFTATINSKLYANSIKISSIEISENFNLKFNKKEVFDKAFQIAFLELIMSITTSSNKEKLEHVDLMTIKSLIDSFNVIDEKFINDKYYAKINVNFNKKKIFNFFESRNIFPSLLKKIDLLILPILINNEKNEIVFFNENKFYKDWNKFKKNYHLLNYVLPTEDIEDRKILENNIQIIEKYNFNEIIKKYGLNNYIILIVNLNNDIIEILSKMQLENTYKIFNTKYENLDINNNEHIKKIIFDIKTKYEDEWKNLNLVNTSIKLPFTVDILSKDYNKVKLFEKTLKKIDLISNFKISSFDNKKIVYKIIFNGSPDKFVNEINKYGLIIVKNNKNWTIQ